MTYIRWFDEIHAAHVDSVGGKGADAQALMAIIRSSDDAEARRTATAQLTNLGMVEPL